jgi:hypothetical protein
MGWRIAGDIRLGLYLASAAALVVWHVGAALLGVFIADRLGVSDGSLDLKNDLRKMAACSLIALSLFFFLFYFAKSPAVFLIYIIVFLFSLKVAYLDASHGFRLIILGTVLAGMIAFVPVVLWLRLPGIFFLYLAALAAWLVLRHSAGKRDRETERIERLKEQNIRRLAGRDPGFATFCYQCHFNLPGDRSCRLRLDGKHVREIKLGQRAYCTSFEPGCADLGPAARQKS